MPRTIFIALCFLWHAQCANAHPVLGRLFPVIEDNLLDVIQSRAHDANVEHTLQTMARKQLRAYFIALSDKSHLSRLDGYQTYTMIPKVTLPAIGNKPSRTVPLLQYVHYFKPVLMVNAKDPLQRDWLQAHLLLYPQATVIVTGGNSLELMKATHHLVAYDAQGEWVKRFNLTHLPAKITHQGGLLLTISEGIAANDS